MQSPPGPNIPVTYKTSTLPMKHLSMNLVEPKIYNSRQTAIKCSLLLLFKVEFKTNMRVFFVSISVTEFCLVKGKTSGKKTELGRRERWWIVG